MIVSVAPVTAPVAAKLAAVAAPEAVSVPVDTSPTVVKFPALAVLLMVRVLPVIPVAELSRPTLAAPLMLSKLPDTAPVDVSVAPATVPVAVSAAQETAPEASTPVVNTSVQFTSLHSSWSQPTLPCAVSPSRVAEPVRASESASRSVTKTKSFSKALALICMLYRSSVPADCCTRPGIDPPKAPKCSFAESCPRPELERHQPTEVLSPQYRHQARAGLQERQTANGGKRHAPCAQSPQRTGLRQGTESTYPSGLLQTAFSPPAMTNRMLLEVNRTFKLQFGFRLHFKRCQALPNKTTFPFFRGPFFGTPCFFF